MVGIFSLTIFLALGIFSLPLPLSGDVPVTLATSSTNPLVASFSFFDSPGFAGRQVFIDRVTFDASGTPESFSPVRQYTSDFPPWEDAFLHRPWVGPISSSGAGVTTEESIQVRQVASTTAMTGLHGGFILSRVELGGNLLRVHVFPDFGAFLFGPQTSFLATSTAANNAPHALVISNSQGYLFWVSGSRVRGFYFNGTPGTSHGEFSLPDSDAQSSYGVSATLLRDGSQEFIAVAYYTTPTNLLKVVTFEAPVAGAPSVFNAVTHAVSPLQGPLSIAQNPRTRKVFLTYLDGTGLGNGKYFVREFTGGVFGPPTGPLTMVSTMTWLWGAAPGFEVTGLPNFETFGGITEDGSPGKVREVLLRGAFSTLPGDFGDWGPATCFPFQANGNTFAGLVTLKSFQTFDFYYRPLAFPATASWKAASKEIHLQGPPFPGTSVTVEATFPELATPSCRAPAANAAGGQVPIAGASDLIASSGTDLTLAFDLDIGREPGIGWAGTTPAHQIRLLDPAETPLAIAMQASTARTLTFRLGADLQPSTVYRVAIASGITTPAGTQLWGPATLTFTTQKAQSGVLASEVQTLRACRDPARTDQIADGSEINASATLHFAVTAVDPAPNTIDVGSLTWYRNGAVMATFPVVQPANSTTAFHGTTTVSLPWGGSYTLRYETASPTVISTFLVSFPGLTAQSPASGSVGAKIDSPIVLTFTEPVAPASITASTLRLRRGATPVGYSVTSVAGTVVTLDPSDSAEGLLQVEATYTVEIGTGVVDLAGNPFVNTPATYSADFSTQASQTSPVAIASVTLYADAGFTQPLVKDADRPATGTIYIRMEGTDGEPLTRDSTVASITGGNAAVLTETASATGIYTGSFSYAGWPDRVPLVVASKVSPAASFPLFITYPQMAPGSPASDSIDVPVASNLTVQADEPLAPGTVTATSAHLRLLPGGAPVDAAVTVTYDAAARQVVLDPAATLTSEGLYEIEVAGVVDQHGNPQLKPLTYRFRAADSIPPTLLAQTPAAGSTDVTIDRLVLVTFSEAVLAGSVTPANVRLLRGGALAGFTLTTTGATVTIDPNDAPDGGLRTDTIYTLEVGPGVTDLKGNAFSNTPATYSTIFQTQPGSTPPATITSLVLFRDALRSQGFVAGESVPATAAVYLKISGTDGATQTRDVTTATLRLSWGGSPVIIPMAETASNSGGFYYGDLTLGALPVYSFPGPLPPAEVGTLSWTAEGAGAPGATLSVRFPAWVPAGSRVQTTAGLALASGATGVRLDAMIDVAFGSPLDEASIGPAGLQFTVGGVAVPYATTWDAANRLVTLVPDDPLQPGATYRVAGPYAATGLRGPTGNPLHREFAFTFDTQASQTPPVSISRVSLFPDAGFDPLEELAADADFPATGTVWLEMAGVDGSALTVDRTIASLSVGGPVFLTETGPSTGIYRGSATFAGLSDQFRWVARSVITPAASRSLLITWPHLTPLSPASGATNVSVYAPVVLTADERLAAGTVTTSTVRVLNGGVPVAASVTFDPATLRLTLTPAPPLPYLTQLTVAVDNVTDLAGNPLPAPLRYPFTTQATAIPPTTITAVRVATDPAYGAFLASGALVAPGQTIFVQIEGVDLSVPTVDYTGVEMVSDAAPTVASATLVEFGFATGWFRGPLTVFPEEGAVLTIRSVTDPTKMTQVRTLARPQYASLAPASGSSDLPLDTLFSVSTTKALDPASLGPLSIRLADRDGAVAASFTLTAPTTLVVEGALATGSPCQLRLTGLRDTDGLDLPALTASFTTRAASFSAFTVFGDAARTAVLAPGSVVDPGSTLWLRLTGRDLRTRRLDTTPVAVSDGKASTTFTLGETGGGVFEGTVTAPTGDGLGFTVTPVLATGLVTPFQTLTGFSVTSVTPADGAAGVPADSWPAWTFSHPLVATWSPDNPQGWFTLIRTSPATTTPTLATLTISLDRRQVTIRPWSIMTLLGEYELRVASFVRDERQRPLGTPFVSRFAVQPPPPPPLEVSSLRHYRDGTFTTPSANVAPDGTLYLEVVAKDQSFSTIDTTRVQVISSDGSLPGNETTLVETGQGTGVFRGSLPIALPVGTLITVQSQGKPVFVITVTVAARPVLTALDPASGATGLFLDQPLSLRYDQAIDAATLASGVVVQDAGGAPLAVTPTLAPDGRTVQVAPVAPWATGSQFFAICTNQMFGTSGVAPVTARIAYTTRSPATAALELYCGLPPRGGQRVSALGEAIPGDLLLVATTTDLFLTRPESRRTVLTVGGSAQDVVLSEVATLGGTFQGQSTLPDQRGTTGQAVLEFFSRPAVPFTIASLPALTGTSPASGATEVGESPVITASFSRLLAVGGAAGALAVTAGGNPVPVRFLTTGEAATVLQWETTGSLPPGATATVSLAGLTDLLGQPVLVPTFTFAVVGSDGILLYEDAAFARPILGLVVGVPEIWVEATASGPWDPAVTPGLTVVTQLNATTPRVLALAGAASPTRRFQCRLRLEPTRSPPGHLVPLVPGERVELSSPRLTERKRTFHYRTTGDTPPTAIRGIALFRDAHFVEGIEGDLAQGRAFIQVTAEDGNWVFPDSTRVLVTSDTDPAGVEVGLLESGPHTGQFRGILALGNLTVATGTPMLRASAGDWLTFTSVADPSVQLRVRYLPETRVEHAIAWPSPVRGDTVTFSFWLTFPADVDLTIYDMAGDEVHEATIHGREGENRFPWRLPRRLANGVYLFELRPQAQTEHEVKRKKVRGKFAVLR